MSVTGHGLQSMHSYQAEPIYLRSPRLETLLEYSGAALMMVANGTRVPFHSNRCCVAVVALWERILDLIS